MATIRQIEANRRNAKKSTGPTSVAGKAASSMNALKSVVKLTLPISPSRCRNRSRHRMEGGAG
jgi:hypothetical protein